ncbi:MAG: gliding motility-associated C-terminal domain-containing protein [Vicingaceae bacterium]|nr:gliding motility-associated C-terminal domain-containing protein [Vicingaceae bacterium]
MKKLISFSVGVFFVSSFLMINSFKAQNNALVLNGAVTVLNGGTAATPIYIVVNQNNPLGIVRNAGHIHSENQYNYVRWVAGTNTGNYVVPFGVGGNLSDYIPFTFNKTTAGSSNIQTSTWFTNVPNFPKPAATNVGPVTNMFNFADSVQYAIDRFWDIQAVATADLTFSYRGVENTTINPTGNVRTQHWNGTTWDAPVLPGNPGVTAGIGSAGPFVGQTTFSPWVLSVIPICEQDTITYNGPFCNNVTTLQNVTHTGTFTGTFTSSPAGLSINASTGAINPSLSTAGTYTVTFTVAATPTCPQMIATTTVTITALDDASFTYSPTTFCITGTNPTPTVTGVAGGTFTITTPGVINATTGEIDLSASGLGTFTVYYNTTSVGNPCPSIDSVQVTITVAPSASFSYDAAQYCQDAVNPILTFGSGASGGVFSTNPTTGLTINTSTGAIDLSTSSSGIYTVYNTIAAAGGCAAALDSTTIEILQVDSALFNYTPSTFCLTGTNPTPAISGTTGGTFTITAPGVINATTGEIDLSASGLGTFTVYYNTTSAGNPCPSIDSMIVNIVNAPGATFTYNNSPYCQGDANELPVFGPNNFAGTFTAAPAGLLFISSTTGELDLTNSSAGTYMVYNNLAASGGCAAAVDSFQITINSSYFLTQAVQICQGDSIMLGGVFQTTNGVYNDTSATINGCDSIISTTLTVNPVVVSQTTAGICQGDSILLGGAFQTVAGTYFDTFTTSLGCDSIIETTLTVNLLGSITVNPVLPVCFGKPIILTATGSGNGTITWYSDAAGTIIIDTGSTIIVNSTALGTFTFYANEVGTCSSTMGSVTVIVGGVQAIINATPTTGPAPLNVTFGNGSTTGVSYLWNFGDGATDTVFEPSHIYGNLGSYTVTLIVTDGFCSDTATVVIDVFGESSILIPNVFTPNGDGSNDFFSVFGENLIEVKGEIFNRWGQKMFAWDNVNGKWDGRTLSGNESPDGTYFFIIEAKGVDGKEYFEKGTVSLIR